MNIIMPQLGETVSEGKITTWLKSVGDEVRPGDNLFEVETDKVTMEVPAVSAGILSEIVVNAGDSAKVGAVVAVVDAATKTAGSAGNARPALTIVDSANRPAIVADRTASEVSAAQDPFFEVRTPSRNYGRAIQAPGVTATPLARRIAVESGVDLAQITGSGSKGRIFARDVASVRLPAVPATRTQTSLGSTTALYAEGSYQDVPLGGMRSIIAARLVQAKQTVPHFYLTADVDVSALIALRAQINEPSSSKDQSRPRVSINDFVIKFWALSLVMVPAANVIWAEDRIMQFSHADIGVAVSVDDGLLTPLVRNAESKPVSSISSEMRDLSERARSRRLAPSEYQGGSSAISNLGMHGVREFAAIINPPQSTILAVGAVRRQAIEQADGTARFTSVMTVTLSCDHRVVDGAVGARILEAFKHLIENPVSALI